MNISRYYCIVDKLKSAVWMCKHGALTRHTRYFSDKISPSKNPGKPCSPKNTINRKDSPWNSDQNDSNDKSTCKSVSADKSNTEQLTCKKRNTATVAIVGGGCATVCTSILLKQNPTIKEIRLIDTDNSLAGPVCDIRQIDTSTTIKHYKKNLMIEGLRNVS